MIRVVLADDHAMFRKGVCALLAASARDVRVVAEAATGDELLARLETTPADVVLLDIAMPGPGVLEVIRRVREAHPSVRVLVLSLYDEEQYALRTLRAGAAGYLTKERSPEDLVTAVRQAFRDGPPFVSPAVRARLGDVSAPAAPTTPAHAALSPREYDVLRRLGAGQSVTEIAERMRLSPKTVSTFRARILRKLGLRTTADIVRYVVDQRLETGTSVSTPPARPGG